VTRFSSHYLKKKKNPDSCLFIKRGIPLYLYIYTQKKKKWMLLKHTCNDYVQWYFIFLFFFLGSIMVLHLIRASCTESIMFLILYANSSDKYNIAKQK
jgi:hypothetical protein